MSILYQSPSYFLVWSLPKDSKNGWSSAGVADRAVATNLSRSSFGGLGSSTGTDVDDGMVSSLQATWPVVNVLVIYEN